MNNTAYLIEIRNINGVREKYTFNSRDDFYAWIVDVVSEDDEILNVDYMHNGCCETLYCSLWGGPLDWDTLAGYLA